jgi:hypothetical protein
MSNRKNVKNTKASTATSGSASTGQQQKQRDATGDKVSPINIPKNRVLLYDPRPEGHVYTEYEQNEHEELGPDFLKSNPVWPIAKSIHTITALTDKLFITVYDSGEIGINQPNTEFDNVHFNLLHALKGAILSRAIAKNIDGMKFALLYEYILDGTQHSKLDIYQVYTGDTISIKLKSSVDATNTDFDQFHALIPIGVSAIVILYQHGIRVYTLGFKPENNGLLHLKKESHVKFAAWTGCVFQTNLLITEFATRNIYSVPIEMLLDEEHEFHIKIWHTSTYVINIISIQTSPTSEDQLLIAGNNYNSHVRTISPIGLSNDVQGKVSYISKRTSSKRKDTELYIEHEVVVNGLYTTSQSAGDSVTILTSGDIVTNNYKTNQLFVFHKAEDGGYTFYKILANILNTTHTNRYQVVSNYCIKPLIYSLDSDNGKLLISNMTDKFLAEGIDIIGNIGEEKKQLDYEKQLQTVIAQGKELFKNIDADNVQIIQNYVEEDIKRYCTDKEFSIEPQVEEALPSFEPESQVLIPPGSKLYWRLSRKSDWRLSRVLQRIVDERAASDTTNSASAQALIATKSFCSLATPVVVSSNRPVKVSNTRFNICLKLEKPMHAFVVPRLDKNKFVLLLLDNCRLIVSDDTNVDLFEVTVATD